MNTPILDDVRIVLPQDGDFDKQLILFLQKFGELIPNGIRLHNSNKGHLPIISIEFKPNITPEATFTLSNNQNQAIKIENRTGEDRESPHKYSSISFDNFLDGAKSIEFTRVDHIGFNLPWFGPGIHPEMEKLRQILKDKSLYHTFPTGEPWDFILPGSEDEIHSNNIDYTLERRPKIEIVSFEKSSTPLIQIELMTNATFNKLSQLFPEGIAVPEIGCEWVYINNPYDIDICLVLNEYRGKGWSAFFKNSRLQ